jgi:hypothetical protein
MPIRDTSRHRQPGAEPDTANTQATPCYAYILASLTALGSFVATLVLALQFPSVVAYITLIAAAVCFAESFAFSWVWPLRPWLWGLILPACFIMYFLTVFALLLMARSPEVVPMIQAAAVASGGFLGSSVAFRIRHRTRPTVP